MDAVPPAPTPDTRPARARLRAVVALVRPYNPNPAVLAAAADLAAEYGTMLLVLGTVDVPVTDWVDGVDVSGPLVESAHGELFASCVETLWSRELVWGVNVVHGRVGAELVGLAEHADVVRVVHGSRRPNTFARRLRRRFTGRLDTALESFPSVVV